MGETVIYADILFFINFVIDGLCLAITALILGRRFLTVRLLCGCALGGLYAIFALSLEELHPVLSLVLHLTAAVFICALGIPFKRAAAVFENACCFFITEALLGGALWGIYTLCGAFAIYRGAFYAELSPIALLASAIPAAAAIAYFVMKSKGRSRARHGDIHLCFRGRDCSLFCLADSGNLLRCPYTGLPVVTVKASSLVGLLGSEELRVLSETPASKGIRPIPVTGLGGKVMLPSFVPETAKARAFGNKEYKEVRLCIAIDTGNNSYGGCDGAAPTCIF